MNFSKACRQTIHNILFHVWEFGMAHDSYVLIYYSALANLYTAKGWKVLE